MARSLSTWDTLSVTDMRLDVRVREYLRRRRRQRVERESPPMNICSYIFSIQIVQHR